MNLETLKNKDYLSIMESAVLIHKSVYTIRRYVLQKNVEFIKDELGRYLVNRISLEEYNERLKKDSNNDNSV